MKRSNLFLTATTACLALASFAFAKSHARSVSIFGCTSAQAGKCTVPTAKVVFLNKISGQTARCVDGKTVHSTVGNGVCGRTLYTNSAD
jgi:hypothetical protein